MWHVPFWKKLQYQCKKLRFLHWCCRGFRSAVIKRHVTGRVVSSVWKDCSAKDLGLTESCGRRWRAPSKRRKPLTRRRRVRPESSSYNKVSARGTIDLLYTLSKNDHSLCYNSNRYCCEQERKLHLTADIFHRWKIQVRHLDTNVSYKVILFTWYDNISRKFNV